MWQVLRYIRKIFVVVIAAPLFVLGVVLIPLPGPGLLVFLAALALLSLEFEFAKRYVETISDEMKQIWKNGRHRFDR